MSNSILVAEEMGALWPPLRLHYYDTMLNTAVPSLAAAQAPTIIMKATLPSRLLNIQDSVQ